MTTEQPNALRLAKWLDAMPSSGYALPNQAAAELRRLYEENQAMLDALKKARAEFAGLPRSLGYEFDHIKAIDAAIAKGEQA